MENYYILNKTTNKVELHFDKATYTSLDADVKSSIKSACLFSRAGSCWVSRGYSGSWSAINAKSIAEKIGLSDAGAEGERLSFAEQQQRKAERAEARADRYDALADRAEDNAKRLQSPLESMRGDTAFFTQPNINTSAGRAFTRQRERMYAAYERGFDEFKRSEYWRQRAETARETAKGCEVKSIAFCQRRIDECAHDIKAQIKLVTEYKAKLERLESGEQLKRYSGEPITAEDLERWIDGANERIDALIDKSSYYQTMIDAQGGQKFDKDSVQVGDVVTVERFGAWTVERKGPKNFTAKNARGSVLTFAYTEITSIQEKRQGDLEIKHGFRAGDVFSVKLWDYETHQYKPVSVTIVKVSAEKATVRVGDGRAKSVSIRPGYNNDYYIPVQTSPDHWEWIFPKKQSED